jgi:PAS domain S-box-containing protein
MRVAVEMQSYPDPFGLLDQLGDALVVVDGDWRVIAQNSHALGISRIPGEAAKGQKLHAIWPKSLVAAVKERFHRVTADGLPVRFEHHHHEPLDGDVWLEIHALPVAAGLAIVARDVTTSKRREARAGLLRELAAALSAALDPAEAGAVIIQRALPALGANAGNVYLLGDDRRELVSVAALGYEPATLEQARRLPLDSATMMAQVVRTGLPIFFDTWDERLRHYPHHRQVHAMDGDRAVAGLPLKVEGRTIGALSLAFPTDRTFADDELHLMVTVADLCGQALERTRLYQSLQESEARFRQLAGAIPEIAWVIGGDGKTLEYINQRWLDRIGVSIASGATPLANERIHPDDRGRISRRWTMARRSGAALAAELRLRACDGSYRWFLCRIEPVRDMSGKVVKWFGAATDIDDTKRAAEAQRFLAELSSTLAISLNPADIASRVARLVIPTLADYCFIDLTLPDGKIERASWAHVDPHEQRLFDESMAELVPQALDRRHPIARVVETGEAQFVSEVDDAGIDEIALPEHRAFAQARRLRSRMSVPLRARGRTLGALTLCYCAISNRRYGADDLDLARDVAERIALAIDNARLYTEARDAEAKVGRLLDAGVVGIIVADQKRILEANDHFLEMVGYTRAELEGGRLLWPAMTPPEHANLDASAVVELMERGVASPYEKAFLRSDGSRLPILIGAAVLENDPLRWISFILDLTERKRGEDEWRAFVDATAHDLRNPLTSVLGQTQLLQRHLLRDGTVNTADAELRLTAIAGAAVRAAGLIDDLIDTARLRAGQPLEMRPMPVDLIALVTACAAEARRLSRLHVIHLDASDATLEILADEHRLERVIRNMLDNAVKFSPAGGEVKISVSREKRRKGDSAVVTIADRGLGIPAADLAHVFEHFWRGANVEGRIHGSGIGLTGARQIVAQHGGEIAVQSVEGEGSTFTLRLPVNPSCE